MWRGEIPNLTKPSDWDGYVYWKGIEVEHYTFGDDVERETRAAWELWSCCMYLESIGVPVNSRTVLCDWFKDMSKDSPLRDFLGMMPSFYEHETKSSIVYILNGDAYQWKNGAKGIFLKKEHFDKAWEKSGQVTYHVMEKLGYRNPDMGQEKHLGCCYCSYEQVKSWLAKYGITHSEQVL
jgi:hypothetical protein